VDLASPLPPRDAMAALKRAGLGVVTTGLAHGTVTAISAHRGFEITTLRRDERTDGRHADVAWTDDWAEDAARRDFTMNALYQTGDGRIWDYVGGVDDLRAGHVRFVGEPRLRIAEDYLRILRYFRFQARYGRTLPDDALLAAIAGAAQNLNRLSVERIWSEWRRILAGPNLIATLDLMAKTGVLAVVIPEGTHRDRLCRLLEKDAPPDPLLRLAALLDKSETALSTRLKLSNEQRAVLSGYRNGPVPQPGADDAALRTLLADHRPDFLIGRTWLSEADATEASALCDRLNAMLAPVFPLQGADLLAAGMKPGPAMGALLKDLRHWWIADGCKADAGTCRIELAKRFGG
jgi:poly(A) polymerase